MRWWQPIAILLLVPVVPAAITAWAHPRSPWRVTSASTDLSWVSLEDALAIEDVIWIDARSRRAYDLNRIPGAIPLNEDDWDAQLEAVLLAWTPDCTVVVYCDGQSCTASQQVAGRLREELGWQNIRVLRDGWDAWTQQQQP